jgi:hypothetical protein
VKTVKEPSDENQTECHEIGLILRRIELMPEGDNQCALSLDHTPFESTDHHILLIQSCTSQDDLD